MMMQSLSVRHNSNEEPLIFRELHDPENKLPVFVNGTNFSASGSFGYCMVSKLQTTDYIVSLFNIVLLEKADLRLQVAGSCMTFLYAHAGVFRMDIEHLGICILPQSQFNIVHLADSSVLLYFDEVETYTFFSIQFRSDFFSAYRSAYRIVMKFMELADSGKNTVLAPVSETAGMAIRNIIHDIIHNNSAIDLKIALLLEYGLEKMASRLAAGYTVPSFAYDSERILKAGELMLMKMDERLSLDEIAVSAFVNKSRLKKEFKKLTGKAFSAFLRDARIAKAMQMLADTDTPIQAISTTVGFRNAGYFSRVFNKKMGCNPSLFRKRQRSPGDRSFE